MKAIPMNCATIVEIVDMLIIQISVMTLVFNIKCPNENCKTNTDGEKSEVLYIRYDENNMKYLYMCSICDTTWKTNDASL